MAIAYMLEILPALGYLHRTGLLFCDFKIDNVIQTQHSLKLIDLGGVYRMDDATASVFGTHGYQAPEIASSGPSIASDLFTVARTLAVLCFDFRGYQANFRFTLPERDTVPVLERYDSLYQLLLTGTAPDPDDRFQSAEEMADQLYGVLREVVSDEDGRRVPAASKLFTGPVRGDNERPDWRVLPRPLVDRDDPAAGYLATITSTDPQQMISDLRAAPDRTTEIVLRLAAELIEVGDWDSADEALTEVEAVDRWEWRVAWYRGVMNLARERFGDSRASFTSVYRALPGELAPKLGLGMACEAGGGTVSEAAGWYEIVSRTDPAFTVATFGLARCRLAAGERAAALAAYDRVPDSSSAYVEAKTARIRCLVESNGAGAATADDLLVAGSILETLPVRGEQRVRLAADVLESALALVGRGGAFDDGRASLLGYRFAERDLRFGVERSYRELARWAPSSAERIALVDTPTKCDRGHGHDDQGENVSTEDVDVSTQAGISCPSCGAPLQTGDRFCERCGARIEDEPQADGAARRVELDLAIAATVSDQGLVHRRNEDSFHLEVTGERNVAVVVCDGISSASAGNIAARDAAGAAGAVPRRPSAIRTGTRARRSSTRSRPPWTP